MPLSNSHVPISPALKTLSNEKLHERTLEAARIEKQATLALLEFLAEVDDRRLYAARGYSSLWEYVHVSLGYSEAQASERVSAMRLMRRVPEVREKLKNEELSLTSTAKFAAFVRREECSEEKTRELLGKIAEKPVREVERILAAEQSTPIVRPDVVRPTGLETSRVSFDVDAEFLALFSEMKNLQGRPDWEMNERLKEAMRAYMRARQRKTGPKMAEASTGAKEASQENTDANGETTVLQVKRKPSVTNSDKPSPVLRAPEVKPATAYRDATPSIPTRPSRYIPMEVRRRIRKRSGNRCEYVDSETGRRCESGFALEFDHILPFAKGGPSIYENLRQLCAGHNRFQAVREYGKEKMRRHFK